MPELFTDRERDLAVLRRLASEYPSIDAAVARLARWRAMLTLPKGTIHIISDIHGEDVKLRHVINNASGTLRPLVERFFRNRLSPDQFDEFLKLIFYPAEMTERLATRITDPAALAQFTISTLGNLFMLVRFLASRYTVSHVINLLPVEYRELMRELFNEPTTDRGAEFDAALVDELVKRGKALQLVHLTGRLVRNLAVEELLIDGDLWDRGPRGDRVVEYLRHQPNVSFVWGNHDTAWFGACMGHEALIAHVLRQSLRYRRLSQLEEGYGLTLQPLERLARDVYADDPATQFAGKGTGLRDDLSIARMQKAAAIMQFKLEGQMIARNPGWGLDHRRLLHRMDLAAGTIQIDGKTWPLLDTHLPTIDPKDPYALSEAERQCMDRTRESFLGSDKLWAQMRYLTGIGSMYTQRDNCLVFHGCVPVDESGNFLTLEVDGQPRAGRALFEALDRVIVRALDQRDLKDLDMMWYLWCGPLSPLFGKDRITTLETYFVADPATQEEVKNPYFSLINQVAFCDRILGEFGVDPADGLIVNGHVPVKIEKGEDPQKRGGKAITIDGAFSEAYGDHGYTLVLEADRIFLATHYHFESVEAALRDGVDIIPAITPIRAFPAPRRVADTEEGRRIRAEMAWVEKLIEAYRTHVLLER